jgi:hypothetical protein
MQRTIVEFLHLSIMATSYHIHFITYSNGKKNMTQLIPPTMCKINLHQLCGCLPWSSIVEDALKDHMQGVLKELKFDNSNKNEYNKTILQLHEH